MLEQTEGHLRSGGDDGTFDRMIYLLYGPDELARSEALQQLKQQVPVDLADLNITTLDGKRLKFETIAAACEAFPFIAEKRLVVVFDLLKHQKAGAEREQLRTYLEQLPSTCDLILVENEEFDKRNVVFTFVKKAAERKQAHLQEFLPKEGADLVRWLQERSKMYGAQLDGSAAQQLIDYVGNEGRPLANEIAKLATYVGRGGRITTHVVDLLVQDNQEQNLFAFIDELSQRRRGPALSSLRRLFDDGQAATYILFMIARQVRLLLSVKELAGQRLRPDDIASQLGQRPFVVKKALDQARGFQDADLTYFHDRVLALDHASKTGRIEPETALDVLVVEMCK